MRQFIRQYPFRVFYAIAIGTASVVWIYIMAMEVLFANLRGDGYSMFATFYETQMRIIAANPILHHHTDSVILYVATYLAMPVAFAGFFFPFAPTLAALVATWAGWGGKAVRVLIGALAPVRGAIGFQEGARIYLILAAFIAFAVGLTFLRVFMVGDADRIDGFVQHLGFFDWRYFLSAWLVAAFFNQGALLEELGWRGFALPVLIRRLGSPLAATLILGVAWALWHMPREVPTLLAGEQTLFDLLHSQVWFILSCCSMSIVATYFVNITGGSVLPVIILHGMLNFVGGMMALERVGTRTAFTPEAPLTWFAAAIVVLLLVGPNLGWKRRLEVHGGDGSTDPSLIWSKPPQS